MLTKYLHGGIEEVRKARETEMKKVPILRWVRLYTVTKEGREAMKELEKKRKQKKRGDKKP